jgi:hypothetical protein
MEEGLLHNPTFVNYVNENCVAAVGHREAHAEVDRVNPITGATEKVCPHYDTIPCAAHQAVASGASGVDNSNGRPASYVCDPTGAREFELGAQQAPQPIIEKLTAAQGQIHDRPLLGSQVQRMMMDLYRGDHQATQGKWKDALASYRKVADEEKDPQFIRDRATARITALQQQAMAAVERARGLENKNEAKRELKKLQRELRDGFDEAKAAVEAALADLEGGH